MLILDQDNQDLPHTITQLIHNYILPTPGAINEASSYSGAAGGVTEKDFFINYLQTSQKIRSTKSKIGIRNIRTNKK